MLKQGLNEVLYKLVGEYTSEKDDVDNNCEDIEYNVESILPSEKAMQELLKVAAQVRGSK